MVLPRSQRAAEAHGPPAPWSGGGSQWGRPFNVHTPALPLGGGEQAIKGVVFSLCQFYTRSCVIASRSLGPPSSRGTARPCPALFRVLGQNLQPEAGLNLYTFFV